MQIVKMLNLERQYASLRPEIDAAIGQVLARQNFILGDEVATLEQEIAMYCRTGYGVGVASGTDALLLSLKAAGVGPGDEVIVPAFTFVATADTVSLLGATPVFADIDPASYTMDVTTLEALVTPATKAIIAVHLYGQAADIFPIATLAKKYGLALLGDTAQALGATYAGEPVCSYGDFGCLSFFPSKNLGAYGDGGMIVTASAEVASSLKMLRAHGSRKKYRSETLGWNSRLDEIQAAILRVKLPYLDQWNRARREHAVRYSDALGQLDEVVLPIVAPRCSHVFHQYTIRVPERDRVQAALKELGVESAVHYPIPLHLQPMYRSLGYQQGSLPEAEKAAREVLSLPIYPDLEESEVNRVVRAVKQALLSTSARSRVALSGVA
ncbi:putative PLP-dependent enzyme possibly involved in cell wall biogenesis [Terriglobus roseus DSM 18391]|uniref:Putative PLP-dependent enzyme possibly involved in cell wall biogenesis n=1 Tax=Terriglobus roseus (strain DSM 18391 / NRRL B-41598 / KBS 63) TaxID=926566 RepID=I3ZE80_TERRK|nr:DegT/DnrJ/EryC1/StrS family aminotransferase [Terriglobus roseus]AFL87548.1 putative PLP-dependent enzyme possibly involved in cell wall biogenesis [Terriglobus roseus DSM 18391]